MRLNRALTVLLVFVSVAAAISIFAPPHLAKAGRIPGAAVYFEIDPVAVPPLINISPLNTSLVTPTSGWDEDPTGDYFNVSIYLKNATLTNVPVGVTDVEVEFNFTDIVYGPSGSGPYYVKPFSFTDCLGMGAGCALTGPQSSLSYNRPAGWYDNLDSPVSVDSATQYEVAAASTKGPWNGTSGLISVITFQIVGIPSPLLGQPDFGPNPLDLSYGDVRDTSNVEMPFDVVPGSLTISSYYAGLPPPAGIFSISPTTFVGPAALGATFNYTVMLETDPWWDVAGFDVTVTWNNTLLNLVACSEGGFLHQGNASTSGNFALTNVIDEYSLRAAFNKTTDPVPSTTDSLVQLEFNVTFISDSYPPPTCPIAFGPTDLYSWAHPERSVEPWFGSKNAVDLAGNSFVASNATYTAPGPTHDVAITAVTSSKTVVGQGYPLNITVTAINFFNYTESLNVTAYANTTPIESQNITLRGEASLNTTFTWNSTGFIYGNYTMSAYAQPVPNETSAADNNYTGGAFTVSIPGDVNGDFKVNLADLVALAQAYGSKPGDANWNPNADINGNGVVNLPDLVILAQHYGQHYP